MDKHQWEDNFVLAKGLLNGAILSILLWGVIILGIRALL